MISFIIGIGLVFVGVILTARIINTGIECEDRTTLVFVILTLIYSYLLVALGLKSIFNIG
jgi:hypothetical protein